MIAEIIKHKSTIYEISGKDDVMVARLPDRKTAIKIAKLYSEGKIPPCDEFALESPIDEKKENESDNRLNKYLTDKEYNKYREDIKTVKYTTEFIGKYENGKRIKELEEKEVKKQ